jgi:hypothetical protein
METTAVKPVNPKKAPSSLLIGVLIVLLVGLGIGVYFSLKPKTKDLDDETSGNDDGSGDDDENPANGRNVTNTRFPLTPDQIAALIASSAPAPNPGEKGESPTNPIYYKDPDFLEAVEEEAKKIQVETSSGRMDAIRALYDVGETMMGRDSDEQECIEELFGKLPNVDFTSNPNRKYLTFPVYGTYEPRGRKFRAELQNIINSGWEGLNLTKLRDDDSPWWCKEIGLNLLVGTTWSNTPTTHNVQFSFAPRSELDFFKKFNRYWVDDAFLADKYIDRDNKNIVVRSIDLSWYTNARAAYCATGMFEFVKRWLTEIDRLDVVTRKEAFESLIKTPENPTGTWYVTWINPETGKDESEGKQGKMK